jgi:hypothetical protein
MRLALVAFILTMGGPVRSLLPAPDLTGYILVFAPNPSHLLVDLYPCLRSSPLRRLFPGTGLGRPFSFVSPPKSFSFSFSVCEPTRLSSNRSPA